MSALEVNVQRIRSKLFLVASIVGLMGWLTVSPASAGYVRENAYFSDSGQVCIEGINATVPIANGLPFQSSTRSYQLDCSTARALPAGTIDTDTYIRAIDGTSGAYVPCGYVASGVNASSSAQANAPAFQASNLQIRNFCGIPVSHFAAAGASSEHDALIWGSWYQYGEVTGQVSNVI